MKEYDVKYNINQEVYILNGKEVCKSKIEKIRIIESTPHANAFNYSESKRLDIIDGLSIEYLVETERETFKNSDSLRIGFDWYNQRDIFTTREEVLNEIK